MTAQTHSLSRETTNRKTALSGSTTLYKLGAAAALLTLLTALSEMLITFLPGGYLTANSVVEWFALLQNNPFLGLRNLGLLNIIMTTLGILTVFTLYVAHRKTSQTLALLALVVSLIGMTVFYATNRAFPMLGLSTQYAAASTDAQRAVLTAAGQAMLSVGQSHTPGTFLAFFFSEIGDILMGIVVLRGLIFSRVTGVVGIVGFGCLLAFDIVASFVPSLYDSILVLAMVGGIANMTWLVMVAIRLFHLDPEESGETK